MGWLWEGNENAHGIAHIPARDAEGMIDEATLTVMISAFLWLVYHCRVWKNDKSEFSQWADARFEAFAVVAGDCQEILEDIVEAIGTAPAPGGSAHPPSGIGEILTALLMSNMNIGSEHGPSKERTIQEEVGDQTPPETENELDEHGRVVSGG